MTNTQLSKEERESIQEKKLINLVFSGCILILGLLICGIVLLISSISLRDLAIIYIIITSVVALLYMKLNRNNNGDLRYGRKNIKTAIIERKRIAPAIKRPRWYEYLPLLGPSVIDPWGMYKNLKESYYITIDQKDYPVSPDFFDRVKEGETIRAYYAEYSGRFMGFDKLDHTK